MMIMRGKGIFKDLNVQIPNVKGIYINPNPQSIAFGKYDENSTETKGKATRRIVTFLEEI
ncbi:MAG: hypothetical protein ACTSWN_15110 [Promethearchaeota archaeon]